MRSIRFSLIVYFLALLLLGLGGVSALAYRTAANTLRDKEASGLALLESEFQAREQDLRAELDISILRRAKQVVNRQSRPFRVEWLNVLTMLSGPLAPSGYLNMAADGALGVAPLADRLTPQPLRFQVRFLEARTLDHLVPSADDLGPDEDGHANEFCQTYFRNGQIWERTTNLAVQAFSLDEQFRESGELMQEQFDDVKHGSLSLRRVTLKVPRKFVAPQPPGPSRGSNPPWLHVYRGPPPANALKTWRALTEPYFFVQYAIDTSPLRNRLQRLADERARQAERLSAETLTTLLELRRRLITLCGLTALSVLFGGLILIWMGLAPLHRLSEAVSRINEKDFELRVDPKSLPSELQPIAHRLRQSLEQLQKAFAREKQAAEDISHDLRTPLAALTTTIEVALKKDRTTAEYRELLDDCQFSARQMTHLVERLLALAKIDSGNNPIRPRPVDVAQIARDAAELVRPLAKARAIALTLQSPAELPMLADADKLRDVLVNLLHNAVDYNRDAGSIDLDIQQCDGAVEIRVADTGVGIRPEAREHLFERFYRADPSRSSDVPHCGLGLAIVKSYVDLMGGDIAVESQPGEGTTFRIRLPCLGLPNDLETAVRPIDRTEVFA